MFGDQLNRRIGALATADPDTDRILLVESRRLLDAAKHRQRGHMVLTAMRRFGAELTRVAFENVGRKSTDKALRTAAKAMGAEDADDLLARVGSAEVKARDVVSAIYPDLARRPGEEVDEARAVVGLAPGQAFRRALCCQPLPGERIVGMFEGSESAADLSRWAAGH